MANSPVVRCLSSAELVLFLVMPCATAVSCGQADAPLCFVSFQGGHVAFLLFFIGPAFTGTRSSQHA